MRTRDELYNIFKIWRDEAELNQNESVEFLWEGVVSDSAKFSYTTIRGKNKLVQNYVPTSVYCMRILPEETIMGIFDCLLEAMREYARSEQP